MGMEKCGESVTGMRPTPKSSVVLLVEDEPVVREITARVLESAGYKVLESTDPKHALGLVDADCGKIDVLLTDIVMPGMNGVDLADRLRQLQPSLVTVFMSGYAESDIVRKGLAGSAVHIQKPFTVSFLLSRIAEALAAATSGRTQLHSTVVPELPSRERLAVANALEMLPNSPPK